MKKCKIILALLSFSTCVIGQIPTFERTYGSFNTDDAEDFVTESSTNGYFWVAGNHGSIYYPTCQITISKIDSLGDLLFFSMVQGINFCGGILPDENGGCYLLGASTIANTKILKIDSDGNLLWSYELAFTPTSFIKYGTNIFIAGRANNLLEYCLMDYNGTIINTFNSSAPLYGGVTSMVVTADNYILCSVFEDAWDSSYYNMYAPKIGLRKIDTNGNVISDIPLSNTLWNNSATFSKEPNGNILIAGIQYMSHALWGQLDPLGNPIWVHYLVLPNRYYQQCKTLSLNNKDIYLASFVADSTNGSWIEFIKADSLGIIDTSWFYNAYTYFLNYDFQPTRDNGFILCGKKTGAFDSPYVIKLDSTGHQTPNLTSGEDQINSLRTGIIIFPNPSNGNLQLSGNFPSHSQLYIYNTIGQELIHPMKLQEGNNSIPLSLDLSDGIYFCRIISDDKVLDEEKLLITK